jgi:hypothetical protein
MDDKDRPVSAEPMLSRGAASRGLSRLQNAVRQMLPYYSFRSLIVLLVFIGSIVAISILVGFFAPNSTVAGASLPCWGIFIGVCIAAYPISSFLTQFLEFLLRYLGFIKILFYVQGAFEGTSVRDSHLLGLHPMYEYSRASFFHAGMHKNIIFFMWSIILQISWSQGGPTCLFGHCREMKKTFVTFSARTSHTAVFELNPFPAYLRWGSSRMQREWLWTVSRRVGRQHACD